MEYRHFRLVHGQHDCDLADSLDAYPELLQMLLDYDAYYRRMVVFQIDGHVWTMYNSLLTEYGCKDETMVVLLARTCKKIFNRIQKIMNPEGLSHKTRRFIMRHRNDAQIKKERALHIVIKRATLIDLVSDSDSESIPMDVVEEELILQYVPQQLETVVVQPVQLELVQVQPVQSYEDFYVDGFFV